MRVASGGGIRSVETLAGTARYLLRASPSGLPPPDATQWCNMSRKDSSGNPYPAPSHSAQTLWKYADYTIYQR